MKQLLCLLNFLSCRLLNYLLRLCLSWYLIHQLSVVTSATDIYQKINEPEAFNSDVIQKLVSFSPTVYCKSHRSRKLPSDHECVKILRLIFFTVLSVPCIHNKVTSTNIVQGCLNIVIETEMEYCFLSSPQ